MNLRHKTVAIFAGAVVVGVGLPSCLWLTSGPRAFFAVLFLGLVVSSAALFLRIQLRLISRIRRLADEAKSIVDGVHSLPQRCRSPTS